MKTLLLIVLAASFVGCSAQFPFKLKPTEVQKQAVDLVVKDLVALAPHVAASGEPIRLEALIAAETTQTYLGLPKVRARSLAAENPVVLAQAKEDARRPAPTIGDLLDETAKEVEYWTLTGSRIFDTFLTAVTPIALTIFGVKGSKYLGNLRGKVQSLVGQVQEKSTAVQEMAKGIDALEDEIRAVVKAEMKKVQSKATEALVAEARSG